VTPEEVAAVARREADARDLAVGPVVHHQGRVQIWLSAAHPAGRTAIIDTDGVERFSASLNDFHWHEFEYDEGAQGETIRELVELASAHLFGRTTLRVTRRLRRSLLALEVPWQGRRYVLTNHGCRSVLDP